MCLKYASLKTVLVGKLKQNVIGEVLALRYENDAKHLFKEFILELRNNMELYFVLNS